MHILINDEIDKNDWNDLVDKCSNSSPFQTPEFYNFYNHLNNYKAYAISVISKGILKALWVISIMKEPGIKGFFSRRGIIFGGPLIYNASDKELSFLFSQTKRNLKKEVIYLETRNAFDYSPFSSAFFESGWKYTPWLNYKITLNSLEDNLMALKSEKRRQIKKSLNEGTQIQVFNNPKEDIISDLYNLFETSYTKRIKKPLPPKHFFMSLSKQNFCKTLIVSIESKIIGGSFLLFDKNTIYDWFRIGDDTNNKKLYPSTVAAWGGIKSGLEQECSFFDFMGAGKPEEKYGVREFKSQFGGELKEYGRFIKIANPLLYSIGKIGLNILSKF